MEQAESLARTSLSWRIVVVGLVSGVLAGLFGVGGGLVLVPALVLLGGLEQHRAHATSLVAIVPTAVAALLPFALDGSVAPRAAAVMALASFPGAFLGASLMRRVPERRLRQAFAVLVLLVAVRLLLLATGVQPASAAVADAAAGQLAALAAVGFVAGVLSSLLGVGGGVVLVPAMVLAGFDQHLAEGTSLAVIVPTAIVGALRHARSGYTRWRLGLMLGGCGVFGGLAGAQLALALPAVWLQRGFAVFLVVVAVRLLLARREAA